MNYQSNLEPRSPGLRYHALDSEELFRPIAFGLVTERMCAEILAERQRILSVIPPARRPSQHRLFAQYDPKRRAEIYQSLLRPFRDEH